MKSKKLRKAPTIAELAEGENSQKDVSGRTRPKKKTPLDLYSSREARHDRVRQQGNKVGLTRRTKFHEGNGDSVMRKKNSIALSPQESLWGCVSHGVPGRRV